MSYPLEKYRYYIHNNEVVAVSTYCGRTVRGVAKCDPRDEFNVDYGKELAAARCNRKVADKRLRRANKKYEEAYRQLVQAENYLDKMIVYLADAEEGYDEALYELEAVEAGREK